MKSTRITFVEITVSARKSGVCPVCGIGTVRARKFSQTLNPWNVNPDGTRRTASQAREALMEKRAAWKPDFRHAKCIEVVR